MKIGMVTIYPNIINLHENIGGVASYTKNLIQGIDQKNNQFFIFSNKIDSKEPEMDENNNKIIRCWDGGIKAAPQIFFKTLKYKNQIDVLHFQYEFFLYEGFIFSLFYPLMLFIYSLMRIPVVTTIHQVPPIKNIGKEFLEKNEIRGNQFIFKTALFILLSLIVNLSKQTIVHEIFFKNILINQYKCKKSKISVIPHGIEGDVKKIDAKQAKRKLNLEDKQVLLFFGYLSGYKGLDLLIDSFPRDNEKYHLIIAGGKHPRLKENPSYLHYLDHLKTKAEEKSNNIEFTGFVKEEHIPLFFSASDLIIFPYISHFSSSGPLSLAFAYEKPFILSNVFKEEINETSLLFDLNSKSLHLKIEQFFNNIELQKKAIQYSIKLKNDSLWKNVGKKTEKLYEMLL